MVGRYDGNGNLHVYQAKFLTESVQSKDVHDGYIIAEADNVYEKLRWSLCGEKKLAKTLQDAIVPTEGTKPSGNNVFDEIPPEIADKVAKLLIDKELSTEEDILSWPSDTIKPGTYNRPLFLATSDVRGKCNHRLEPRRHDVLFGPGCMRRHAGNRQMIELVNEYAKRFQAAGKKDCTTYP